MATRTVVCPECDAPLAPGRFACGACGVLLATVASGSRSLFPAPPVTPVGSADEPEVTRDDTAAVAEASAPDPEPAAQAVAESATAESATAEPATAARAPAPAEPPAHEPVPLPPGAMWATPTGPAPAASPAMTTAAAWPSTPAPTAPTAAPSWPEHPAWPPAPSVNGAMGQAVPLTAAVAIPVDAVRNPAGAYLPPSAVLPPAEALPLPSAKAATPAKPVQSALADSVGSLTLPSDPPAAVISIGAGISAIGFLLPWADVVLGSTGIGGFLDRWGLAGPGHLVVFVMLLGLAALAAFSHRLPRQLRPGLPAVGLGFLLVGLAWPYLFGPFGATVGVYVITAGGLLLVLAGTLELAVRRHAGPVASV